MSVNVTANYNCMNYTSKLGSIKCVYKVKTKNIIIYIQIYVYVFINYKYQYMY